MGTSTTGSGGQPAFDVQPGQLGGLATDLSTLVSRAAAEVDLFRAQPPNAAMFSPLGAPVATASATAHDQLTQGLDGLLTMLRGLTTGLSTAARLYQQFDQNAAAAIQSLGTTTPTTTTAPATIAPATTAPATTTAQATTTPTAATGAPTVAAGTAGAAPNGTRYVVYGDSVKAGGSRNWRDNNPGNIEAGTFATNHGAIGSDGRFAIFPTPQAGSDALVALLGTPGYQAGTLRDAMLRYAPQTENNTAAYLQFIEGRTGLNAATPMSQLSPADLSGVASAINTYEGGRPGTVYTPGGTANPPWAAGILGTP